MQHVAVVIVALKITRKHHVTRIDFLYNLVALSRENGRKTTVVLLLLLP